jgi:murein DD-endopeptidase MepM/ murein hydrolase activator NlpD
MLELKADVGKYYLVKKGDSAESIARAANVSALALVKKNGEIEEGRIVELPPQGNLYTVQPNDDVISLCGSKERFEELNGTDVLYPGMVVRI